MVGAYDSSTVEVELVAEVVVLNCRVSLNLDSPKIWFSRFVLKKQIQ